MRSLGGFVLLAGLGVGLFVYLPAPVDSGTSLDSARREVAARIARAQQAAATANVAHGARTFAPEIALPAVAGGKPRPVAATNEWPGATSVTPVSVQQRPGVAPEDPAGRYELALNIQRQLRRVGCYYGKLNGSWGVASKYAMKDFMDRVNSALPFDNPDYVLLSLVQSQPNRVCGEAPGAPQMAAANPAQGLPWQTTTEAQTPTKPLFTPVASSVMSEQLPGRMAIGGPLPPASGADVVDISGGAAAPGATTTALTPSAPAASPPKSRPTKSASRHREGPGTPRYNLLLSLGGVY